MYIFSKYIQKHFYITHFYEFSYREYTVVHILFANCRFHLIYCQCRLVLFFWNAQYSTIDYGYASNAFNIFLLVVTEARPNFLVVATVYILDYLHS